MELFIRALVLGAVLSITCKIFFETILEKRKWKRKWIGDTELLAFLAGVLLISFSRIPPYIIQPIRFTAVLFLTVQLYFQIKPASNLILSLCFCTLYWITAMLSVPVLYVLPLQLRTYPGIEDWISNILLLGVVILFHFWYTKEEISILSGTKWLRFAYFPVFSLAVIMAFSMLTWETEGAGNGMGLLAIAGFGGIHIFAFYFIVMILKREAKLQKVLLLHERTQNQMNLYRNMQTSYEQQRRLLHDYKNQMTCILGMLETGRIEETIEYMEKLTGKIWKNLDYVNTNHPVINTILNQKYQYARERDITMAMTVNDLSGLCICEEDLVVLLVNLIDNAVEACEKLETGRSIQMKLNLEEDEFILSIRNPVKEPVSLNGKTIPTTKEMKSEHGIGLLNIDAVIKKNKGTSIIKCEEGTFYFSAMIPAVKRGV